MQREPLFMSLACATDISSDYSLSERVHLLVTCTLSCDSRSAAWWALKVSIISFFYPSPFHRHSEVACHLWVKLSGRCSHHIGHEDVSVCCHWNERPFTFVTGYGVTAFRHQRHWVSFTSTVMTSERDLMRCSEFRQTDSTTSATHVQRCVHTGQLLKYTFNKLILSLLLPFKQNK